MKITFVEEIEDKKAWHQSMFCPRCGDYLYRIHHQLQPETSNCWWLECKVCGLETSPTDTREDAIKRWKIWQIS